ncbi:unnamed protein product [Caenorhabditis nigoni]
MAAITLDLKDSGHQSQKNRCFDARTRRARQADLSLHLRTNWRTSYTGRQFLAESTKVKPNLQRSNQRSPDTRGMQSLRKNRLEEDHSQPPCLPKIKEPSRFKRPRNTVPRCHIQDAVNEGLQPGPTQMPTKKTKDPRLPRRHLIYLWFDVLYDPDERSIPEKFNNQEHRLLQPSAPDKTCGLQISRRQGNRR